MRHFFLTLLFVASTSLPAQSWNDPRALSLVTRATERRSAQLADTALRSYRADARGYLTFLAQLGEGFTQPPKVVRTDQIASDIYWRAPNQSKQLIKGRRDTLLLPTDIRYHRDHLGIIQNNFPNIIRLGDGDEVEDVPHPLSPAGLSQYDYALRDSLRIQLGPRALNVYEVRVRPKDDRAPRAVGAVYIDRESGEVVRMTLSFTRAALKDESLVDVSVVLENGLIEGRFWLPRSQEIEIRRTGTWLEYPVRGIIRGRWEIADYDVNADVPAALFNGPEIQAAPGATVSRSGAVTTRVFTFSGGILDSLPPDVKAAADVDVIKIQEEARALVRAQALARGRSIALSGARISDFVRANRIEGIAIGMGLSQGLGGGVRVGGGASYGTSDARWKGYSTLSYARPSGATFSAMGYDRLRDVSDVVERSGLINSFAAQNFGSDYTDLYRVRGIAASVRTGPFSIFRATGELAWERETPAGLHGEPASGRYEPAFNALAWRQHRLTLGLDVPTRSFGSSTEWAAALRIEGIRGQPSSVPGGAQEWQRLMRESFTFDVMRDFRAGRRLVLRTFAAGLSNAAALPSQRLVWLGGPSSAPGYDFHTLASRAAVTQRVEWHHPVPFFSVPLGAWGRTPASITLAPYVHGAWLDGIGWKPSVGVGALSLFELLRVDVARGLRDGRWSFNLDVSRTFWPVL
jgi:hypothetical protein